VGHLHRLIVCDLDGTLIDSRTDLADAANALVIEMGGRPLPTADIARMVGEGAAMLVRRALEAAGLAIDERSLPRFLELYDERLLRTTQPYDGIIEALDELANRSTLALLTNKPMAPTRKLLPPLGLDRFFATVVAGDGPFPRKPDPTSLRHLMSLHGAREHDTVLVGDSRIDVETARAAGTGICLVRFGFEEQRVPSECLRGDEGHADDPRRLPDALLGMSGGK
jgi:phosphoglycolate phosphatase